MYVCYNLGSQKEESQVLTIPLNQQEALVIERYYCDNQPIHSIAWEMHITESRVYQIRARALAKIKRGSKPLPKLVSITKINLKELLK